MLKAHPTHSSTPFSKQLSIQPCSCRSPYYSCSYVNIAAAVLHRWGQCKVKSMFEQCLGSTEHLLAGNTLPPLPWPCTVTLSSGSGEIWEFYWTVFKPKVNTNLHTSNYTRYTGKHSKGKNKHPSNKTQKLVSSFFDTERNQSTSRGASAPHTGAWAQRPPRAFHHCFLPTAFTYTFL